VKANNKKPKGDRMRVLAGIDLHSNNAMCGIVDSAGKRLLHKKVPCELPRVLEVLAPYKERLESQRGQSRICEYAGLTPFPQANRECRTHVASNFIPRSAEGC
jgi:hypothetical protein